MAAMTVAFVTSPLHIEHFAAGHPESPDRLEAVLSLLRECGLLERLLTVEARDATADELALVHDPRYIEALDRACAEGGGWADMDTYMTARSCAAARQAVGAVVAATDAVLSGDSRSAFCAVRPPGHHARPTQAMGFCLANNVAIAAAHAHSRGIERIAIIDIDVHHGNGTQDAFYSEPDILYVSTHQYPYYPGTGRLEEIGEGEAAGTNVNIPLAAGSGDEEYATAFERVVEPIVRRFEPHLVLVSCGFDAHFADPLASMSLSASGYGDLASRIVRMAGEYSDGRLVVALEGGYDLTAIAWGARIVIETMLGETPAPDPLGRAPGGLPARDVDALLEEERRVHGLA
jgi:acetoin utilization deacetylase AcuC-like enzyme